MVNDSAISAVRLGDYARMLRRRWLSLLLCVLIGTGAALAYLYVAPKAYRATTGVLVTATGVGNQVVTDKTAINMDTEAQLVTSTDTLDAVAQRMHVSAAQAADMAGDVSVTVPPNTDILDITYSGKTPVAAQSGSLMFAQAYLDQRSAATQSLIKAQDKALQSRIDAVNASLAPVVKAQAALPTNSPNYGHLQAQITALNNQLTALSNQQNQIRAAVVTPGQITSQAALPTSPSSPNRLVVLTGGILLGLLAGVSLAMLRHRSDDLIRDPEDLFRRTGVPVTTVLSTRLHAGAVTLLPPLSADGRGYARLRNLVTTNLRKNERPVVVVAGVRHGGGPVAANLAASLALAGEDVYLVCADVFGNTATALLGGGPRPGLAEVLADELDVHAVTQTVPDIPRLRVIGPGLNPDRADALLQTRSPRTLIDGLLGSAGYIVIEAPATADSPDAQTLANMAELAVLVVEVNQTGAREVLDACAQFESMGTQVLGAVVAHYGRDAKADYDDVEAPEPRLAGAEQDRTAATGGSTAGDGASSDPGEGDSPDSDPPAGTPATTSTDDGGAAASSSELVPPWPGGRTQR